MTDPFSDHLLQDARQRLQLQGEYTVAAFKTLTLINGGALVALLTYLGNVGAHHGSLRLAFGGYALGLFLAAVAHVFAYLSQGNYMQVSTKRAIIRLGEDTDSTAGNLRWGNIQVVLAVFLTLGSIGAFIVGSWFALVAIT